MSDSDIFKAQFYKFYSQINKKDYFIGEWKKLEGITKDVFHPNEKTPIRFIVIRIFF